MLETGRDPADAQQVQQVVYPQQGTFFRAVVMAEEPVEFAGSVMTENFNVIPPGSDDEFRLVQSRGIAESDLEIGLESQ